jgi:hypothetical protein
MGDVARASAGPRQGRAGVGEPTAPGWRTLLGCTAVDDKGAAKVDLGRRVLYGFLTRAGWRREEALGGKVEAVDEAVEDEGQALDEVPALTWKRLDLAHGVVQLDREKTGRPRPVPIDADVARALEAWRTLTPKAGDGDLVFVDMTGAPVDRHEAADLLRRDLLAAGVDRTELHDTSSPLRAVPSGCTTCAPPW